MRFTCYINLDDESECVSFLQRFATNPKRKIARSLGFTGKGSTHAAKALWNYAMNRHVAFTTRREGRIETALQYEGICDRIYKQDIQPIIECW